MDRIVLSFDQSLNVSGYAVFRGRDLVDYGTFTTNAKQDMDKRLLDIMNSVKGLYDKYHPDVICFEDIQDQGHNAQTYQKLAFVKAVLLLFCAIVHTRYEVMPPSHWRRLLGGDFGRKREEQKAHAIQLVKDRFNIDVDSDTADAICIGLAYIEQTEGE